MHDIDATTLEGETSHEHDESAPLGEGEMMELAEALTEITSEEELDQFLGDLAKRAVGGARRFLATPTGKAIMSGVKAVGKQVLPQLARAGADAIMQGAGDAAEKAVNAVLGNELEPSAEISRKFIDFAHAAIKRAESAPQGAAPVAVAKGAIVEAARRHWPSLLAPRRARADSPFRDADATKLAVELLETTSEEELDMFLGKLVSKAASGLKKFASSSVGKTLISGIKGIAKQALPALAGAAGNFIAPGIGGAIGGKLGSAVAGALEAEEEMFEGGVLGSLGFESEEEAFEHQDEIVERAKRIIHVAGAAAQRVSAAPAGADLRGVVRGALREAVKRYAPDLIEAGPPATSPMERPIESAGARGHWYRRGDRIILVGV